MRCWEVEGSCIAPVSNNHVYFHQHNGKADVTIFVFINIMERLFSGIFPPFVFNNIMEDTFIFCPPRFFAGSSEEIANRLIFSDIALCENSAVYC